MTTFRIYIFTYRFNHRELAELLGFQHGPHVFIEVSRNNDMQLELDGFWGSLTEDYPPDYERMNYTIIHNPTIRYFQMVLAQTFFGRCENMELVSKEDLFIIFSVFQSRPINSAAFLLSSLDKIANSTRGYILVGGKITHIALALGLNNQIENLVLIHGHNLIDIEHCLNKSLVRREGSNEFKILIGREVVYHIVIPDPKRMSVHNHENWLYRLEDHGETPTPTETPPSPEYHPTPPLDISSSSYSAGPPNGCSVDYELNNLRR